ncbi:unnamed protein product [Calicophoron daubneyi]|uniref:Uncharacterized protein n=1 Tax=Calicophoron daubneyi TaxID=300641 RepID=A0AAV2TJH7_CALDB
MDLKEKTLKNEKSDSDEPDKLRSQFTPLSKEHSGASRSDEARTPKNELLVARPSTDKNVSSGTETSESEADTDAPDRFESAIGVTTVLDLLEDMSYQKKLSNIQAAHLKSKYLKLCSLLSRRRRRCVVRFNNRLMSCGLRVQDTLERHVS